MQRSLVFLMGLFLAATVAFGSNTTDRQQLQEFAAKKRAENKVAREKAHKLAAERNLPVRIVTENRESEFVGLKNGRPIYYTTSNANAAISIRTDDLWPGGASGLSLSGNGYNKLGVWDAGKVRNTHQEFTNTGSSRVTQQDGASSLSSHSTHVAGTLIAGGVTSSAKGMAYAATLDAYDWTDDESEMATAAANGLEISNHSYGQVRGWANGTWSGNSGWHWFGWTAVSQTEDSYFGLYDAQSQDWDKIAYDAPYYLIVKSAGNDRGEGPSAGTSHYVWNSSTSQWEASTTTRDKDGGSLGYDTIGNASIAKNVLTVGAVDDISSYNGPSSVVMTSFSGWGPADDGRIKPDIVANGSFLHSTDSGSDASYTYKSGTSMASPNAAGTLALLQQHYKNLNSGQAMRSATLKALVIQTADEAGSTTGPDYKFGWGLLNAERAAAKITEDGSDQDVIREQTLSNGSSWSTNVSTSGNHPLRVTVAWTDVEGTAQSQDNLDPTTSVLVNELDLRLTGPTGTHYPFKLDRTNPSAAATSNSENNLDNVEQVYIASPAAGTYTITVDHDGTLLEPDHRGRLKTGSQDFSVIISGNDNYTAAPAPVTSITTPSDGEANVGLDFTMQWGASDRADRYKLYVGTDGNGSTRPTNFLNGVLTGDASYDLSSLSPNSTYYVQIVAVNSAGDASASPIFSFSTLSLNISFPYSEDFDALTPPNLPMGWSKETMVKEWVSRTGSYHSADKCLYSFSGFIQPADDWLFSPPFSFEANKVYTLTFWYRGWSSSFYETLEVKWGTNPSSSGMNTGEIFIDENFNGYNYRQAQIRIVPNSTGTYYIGWHNMGGSNSGAVYIDDVAISESTPSTLATEAPPGKCLSFDGSNDFVQVGAVNSVRTMEFYLYPNSSTDVILELSSSVYLALNAGTLDMVGVSGETFYIDGNPGTSVTLGKWSHIAVLLPSSLNATGFNIGKGNSNYLSGKVDELRIWKTARSQADIQNTAHIKANTSDENLWVYYKFDHSSGTTLTDMSTNPFSDGALMSMSTESWSNSYIPLGDDGCQVHSTTPTCVGETGKHMEVQILNNNGDGTNNYVGIYAAGNGDQFISDVTLPGNISERVNVMWGVEEYGDVTANLVFSYANLPGADDPNSLVLLKRHDESSPWYDVTGNAVINTSEQTFTLEDQDTFSDFTFGSGSPIAIELTNFDAVYESGGIKVRWETATEIQQLGYNILRSDDKEGDYTQVNETMIMAEGSGVIGSSYEFVDTVEDVKVYWYKIQSIESDGSSKYYGPVQVTMLTGVETGTLPATFALKPNYPNPFNPSTSLRYDLAAPVHVHLAVYDVMGRQVKTLVDAQQPAGRYAMEWNATSDANQPVASGMYFLIMHAGDRVFQQRMLLVR